jgi:hypothetical protein
MGIVIIQEPEKTIAICTTQPLGDFIITENNDFFLTENGEDLFIIE